MHQNGYIMRPLGRTGFTAGRLGVSGGYGASAEAIELAFEKGVNYFYHGSIRRDAMTRAIKNIAARGQREKIFVVAQIYWRMFRWPVMRSFEAFLKKTGLDYVDGLLLGWHNANPDQAVLDICQELKEKKLARFIGISGHNRKAFPEFAKTGLYDFFHTRYNAVHRGGETEVFPLLPSENRPGVVVYTATSWSQLPNPGKTPPGEKTPSGSDCYRFVMSNPSVDVCITGPKNMDETKEALRALERGPMTPDELNWMRRVGDYIHR
jgi:aryl-alcohol dehydrogenase-like predicted oxidoreductase